MSANLGRPLTLTADVWVIAADACTDRQLRVLELRERHGMSWHMIALTMDLGHATVRGHYRAAVHNVNRAVQNGSR